MTCLLFSQVVLLGRQTEVKGRGDDSGKILSGCWWSRQNVQGTKSCRLQCKAKDVTAGGYKLKACWYFKESLQRYKLALCFFLLCILAKEFDFPSIIWFESRTGFHCQSTACRLTVPTVVFFCLIISRHTSIRNFQVIPHLKLPWGQKTKVTGWSVLKTTSRRSDIRNSLWIGMSAGDSGNEALGPLRKEVQASAGRMEELGCVHTDTRTFSDSGLESLSLTHCAGTSLVFAKTQTKTALTLSFPDSLSTPLMLAESALKKEKLWTEGK